MSMKTLNTCVSGLCIAISITACVGNLPKKNTSPSPDDIKKIPLTVANKPEGKEETYFDPNRTKISLFDTHDHKDDKLGPYFRVKDFSKTGDVGFRFARIDPAIVNCLSRVHATLDKPIIINSSYRNWAYNNQLVNEGKTASKTSFHLSGKAADFSMPGASASSLVKTVYSRCGCGVGVGVGNGWFHVDTRGRSTRPWGYGKTPSYKLNTARNIHKKMCGAGRSDTTESVSNVLNSVAEAIRTMGEKIKSSF